MDNFWFWAGLTWNVMCAWFATWPAWLQVFGLLLAAYGLLWLVWLTVIVPVRLVRRLRKPRLTLVIVQAEPTVVDDEEVEETQETPAVVEQEEEKPSATIISIEAYLRRVRVVREAPEEGA